MPVGAMLPVEGGEVELVDHVEDEPGQVAFGQPVAQVGWEQEGLIAVTAQKIDGKDPTPHAGTAHQQAGGQPTARRADKHRRSSNDPPPQRGEQRRLCPPNGDGGDPRVGMAEPLLGPPGDLSASAAVQPPPRLDRLRPRGMSMFASPVALRESRSRPLPKPQPT